MISDKQMAMVPFCIIESANNTDQEKDPKQNMYNQTQVKYNKNKNLGTNTSRGTS